LMAKVMIANGEEADDDLTHKQMIHVRAPP
jgi:hypothetical protein